MTQRHSEKQGYVTALRRGYAGGTSMTDSSTGAGQTPPLTVRTHVGTEVSIPLPRHYALDDIAAERIHERKFRELADEWHEETDWISSPSKRKNHKAYRKILSMGRDAIPHILRDLRDRGGDWSEALIDISGENPIPPEIYGKRQFIVQRWLEWGRRKGYDV